MNRLKYLLERGYFPVQLPPGFVTSTFAATYPNFSSTWSSLPAPATRPEKFSVARSSYYRRETRIVNPISYFLLAQEIDKYWPQISKHFRKSRMSLSRPTFAPGLRAIKISKFSELYEAKITRAAGYRFVLITDISSFFPTIYTHTIPWAIHGKAVAKRNRQKDSTYFGNILDSKSMGVQDWQTIGLPIGPDTSHIIAELIATSIDVQLKESLSRWPAGFRYVDDYYLFFDTRDEADRALTELTKAVSNFELQINPSKTRILEVKGLVEESWKYTLKKLAISAQRRSQKNDIHNYFEELFSLEGRYKDESLVKYGLKQISSHIIKKPNWDIFEAYLLKCGFSYPNALHVIVNIFATYHHFGYPINKIAIRRFCNNLIRTHAIADHHSEVSWLLWLCKELELSIRREVVREIEGMSSSVCSLIALDLYHSGIVKTKLQISYLSQFESADALTGSHWLLAYEAGRRGWLKNDFIDTDPFISKLNENGVEFYEVMRKCKPIFNFKVKVNDGDVLADLFDSDRDIDDLFDFDEMDEEYFDSSEDDDYDDAELDNFLGKVDEEELENLLDFENDI